MSSSSVAAKSSISTSEITDIPTTTPYSSLEPTPNCYSVNNVVRPSTISTTSTTPRPPALVAPSDQTAVCYPSPLSGPTLSITPTYESSSACYETHADNDDNGTSFFESFEKSQLIACKKLMTACSVCVVFMVIEVIAGYIANSLALLSDASHLLSDVCSFLISLFAIWVSTIKGNAAMSFGYHRAEILGALLSVLLIWGVTGWLVYEAVLRLFHPSTVDGRIMFATAVFGTLANLFMTHILQMHSHGIGAPCDHDHHDHSHDHHNHSDVCNHSHSNSSSEKGPDTTSGVASVSQCGGQTSHAHRLQNHQLSQSVSGLEEGSLDFEKRGSNDDVINMNLRAAYIHALGDLLQNVGVMLAAGLIWWRPDWTVADPMCTLLFSVLVVFSTVSIIKESLNVLMEGSPGGIDMEHLTRDLLDIEDVVEVHDLHVWSLSVGKPALACHLVILQEKAARPALRRATSLCQRSYGILHTTIQIDYSANKSCCDTIAHQKCGSSGMR
eukprot:GHVQ01015592.1.p1 GENE.GHVQ01015592.1~~GHVQ01015592.1.p1  ORF type:complete len:527 (+),score=41.31 GHVQ01015592.1:87-1583(+)